MQIETSIQSKNRLIVVLPGILAGNVRLAYRAYWSAQRAGLDVLYLALTSGRGEELSVARSLATMKAVTAGSGVGVETAIVAEIRLVSALREIWRDGDEILCLDGHTITTGFLSRTPVLDVLQSWASAPVHSLAGFYRTSDVTVFNHFLTLLFWIGSIAILAGFAFLEIHIDHDVHGAIRLVMLILTLLVEIGALFAWTRIIQR